MALVLPEDVADQMQRFEGALGEIEAAVRPLLAACPATVAAELPPLERAKLHITLAQAAAAVFALYLRACGSDPQQHPVAKEEARLQLFRKRLKKVAAEKETSEAARVVNLNVAAANRFINAALPDLSHQQRQALREAGKQPEEKQERTKSKGDQGAGKKAKARDHALAFLADAMADVSQAQEAGPPADKPHKRKKKDASASAG